VRRKWNSGHVPSNIVSNRSIVTKTQASSVLGQGPWFEFPTELPKTRRLIGDLTI